MSKEVDHRMTDSPIDSQRALVMELLIVLGIILAVAKVLSLLTSVAFIAESLHLLVAILFLYTPIVVLWVRRRRIEFLDRTASDYFTSLLTFFVAALIIFPLFLLGAHVWQLGVGGKVHFQAAPFPDLLGVMGVQLLLIALPEEFFFRGYFQSAANVIFTRRVRFLGASIGLALPLTALIFAFAHSLILYRWWQPAIFFPALLFGYLRERTGSITAPVLFHAACNIIMDWVSRSYV